MPPSLIDTSGDLLWELWELSLILATAAVATAFILVGRRAYEAIRDRKRDARRKELEAIIWGVLQGPAEVRTEAPPALRRGDGAILCDLALNLLRPLRGAEADRIVKLLEIWGIQVPIRSILRHGSRGQRIRMLTLLAHFEDHESLDILKQWIGNSDLYIQLAALRSLAVRSAVEALPEILKHLIRAKRHNMAMLADVLERFGEPAIGVLVPLAGEAAQLDVRLASITALGAIGSLDTVPALIALAYDPVADIRAQSIAALGRIGDTRAEAAIVAALKDPESIVRLQAAQAAGKLQMEDTMSTLIDLLGEESWWVRYRSAEALYRMGGAGPALLRSAAQVDTRGGAIAAQVLSELEAV
jgi:hypothetical protein